MPMGWIPRELKGPKQRFPQPRPALRRELRLRRLLVLSVRRYNAKEKELDRAACPNGPNGSVAFLPLQLLSHVAQGTVPSRFR